MGRNALNQYTREVKVLLVYFTTVLFVSYSHTGKFQEAIYLTLDIVKHAFTDTDVNTFSMSTFSSLTVVGERKHISM